MTQSNLNRTALYSQKKKMKKCLFCKCKSEIDGILLVVHASIHDHQNFCESALSVRKTKQFPLPFNHIFISFLYKDIGRCFETLHQGALEEHQAKKPHQQVPNPNNVNNPPSKNCEL